ncbi:flippase-like domain-containing protein [Candidatus Fermentibacterales bacterium]|nr:flippase-like domain-containing protein [Candidatus Fermentibacterales bacterium]
MNRRLFLVLLLAIVLYTAMVLLSDIRRVGDLALSFDWSLLPLILVLPLTNYFLRFLKWHYFLRRLGIRLPFRRSLHVFLAGFSLTVSPGKLGELVKCVLLREREGLPVSVTSSAVVAERATDLMSMILIALGAALLSSAGGVTLIVAAGAVFVALFMAALLWGRAFGLLTSLLCRLPFLDRRRESLCSFRQSALRLLDARSLLLMVPLGIISWGVEAAVLSVAAASLGFRLPLVLSLLAHSAGTIAGSLSMIPGGLGLTEVTIDVLIEPALGSAPAAALTTIGMRFATLWLAVVTGLVALGLWKAACGPRDRP